MTDLASSMDQAQTHVSPERGRSRSQLKRAVPRSTFNQLISHRARSFENMIAEDSKSISDSSPLMPRRKRDSSWDKKWFQHLERNALETRGKAPSSSGFRGRLEPGRVNPGIYWSNTDRSSLPPKSPSQKRRQLSSVKCQSQDRELRARPAASIELRHKSKSLSRDCVLEKSPPAEEEQRSEDVILEEAPILLPAKQFRDSYHEPRVTYSDESVQREEAVKEPSPAKEDWSESVLVPVLIDPCLSQEEERNLIAALQPTTERARDSDETISGIFHAEPVSIEGDVTPNRPNFSISGMWNTVELGLVKERSSPWKAGRDEARARKSPQKVVIAREEVQEPVVVAMQAYETTATKNVQPTQPVAENCAAEPGPVVSGSQSTENSAVPVETSLVCVDKWSEGDASCHDRVDGTVLALPTEQEHEGSKPAALETHALPRRTFDLEPDLASCASPVSLCDVLTLTPGSSMTDLTPSVLSERSTTPRGGKVRRRKNSKIAEDIARRAEDFAKQEKERKRRSDLQKKFAERVAEQRQKNQPQIEKSVEKKKPRKEDKVAVVVVEEVEPVEEAPPVKYTLSQERLVQVQRDLRQQQALEAQRLCEIEEERKRQLRQQEAAERASQGPDPATVFKHVVQKLEEKRVRQERKNRRINRQSPQQKACDVDSTSDPPACPSPRGAAVVAPSSPPEPPERKVESELVALKKISQSGRFPSQQERWASRLQARAEAESGRRSRQSPPPPPPPPLPPPPPVEAPDCEMRSAGPIESPPLPPPPSEADLLWVQLQRQREEDEERRLRALERDQERLRGGSGAGASHALRKSGSEEEQQLKWDALQRRQEEEQQRLRLEWQQELAEANRERQARASCERAALAPPVPPVPPAPPRLTMTATVTPSRAVEQQQDEWEKIKLQQEEQESEWILQLERRMEQDKRLHDDLRKARTRDAQQAEWHELVLKQEDEENARRVQEEKALQRQRSLSSSSPEKAAQKTSEKAEHLPEAAPRQRSPEVGAMEQQRLRDEEARLKQQHEAQLREKKAVNQRIEAMSISEEEEEERPEEVEWLQQIERRKKEIELELEKEKKHLEELLRVEQHQQQQQQQQDGQAVGLANCNSNELRASDSGARVREHELQSLRQLKLMEGAKLKELAELRQQKEAATTSSPISDVLVLPVLTASAALPPLPHHHHERGKGRGSRLERSSESLELEDELFAGFSEGCDDLSIGIDLPAQDQSSRDVTPIPTTGELEGIITEDTLLPPPPAKSSLKKDEPFPSPPSQFDTDEARAARESRDSRSASPKKVHFSEVHQVKLLAGTACNAAKDDSVLPQK